MAKISSNYACQNCGARYARWQGRCDACGEWNTIAEAAPTSGGGAVGARAALAVSLRSVKPTRTGRLSSGIGEFDRTLGGGIVPGSLILIGGDPGIGKSTLVLDVARKVAAKQAVLYISAEESAEQVKLRADRLGSIPERLQILPETDLDVALATAASTEYSLVIIDSIQAVRTTEIPAQAGSVSQVATGASKLQGLAKSGGPAVFIIGHVTKEGGLAGPKTLEHLVDAVLYLEGERSGELRLLRGTKNRFGSTGEIGLFRMTEGGLEEVADPSNALLDPSLAELPGTMPTVTVEGVRPMAVELQALTSPSGMGYPRRAAAGIETDRLQLLCAVLTRRANLPLASQDVYVSVVGGVRISDPGIGLALALAIASAHQGSPVTKGLMAFGEVGLSGEIRAVAALERRISEARRLGYRKFLVPRSAKPSTSQGIIKVGTITEAITASGIIGPKAAPSQK
jgi:DNA repair protein RadA/Sms